MRDLRNHLFVSVLLAIIFFSNSCNQNDENPIAPEIHKRGEIVEFKISGSFSNESIQQLLNVVQLNIPFTLSNSVQTLSVQYYTVDQNGNEELASGAIFIPNNLIDMPIISLQHGTETYSQAVASVSPTATVEGISGLMLASMGYLVFAPDYLGFGESDIMHPYMHTKSLTPCIIDFIRAGKIHAINENISFSNKLFLTGYSEGGYLSLAAQKDIEENYPTEFELTAVAPLSGPYDLRGTADSIFVNKQYKTPIYIGFMLTTYNNIYGWNKLDDIFKAPYSSSVTSLFDGSKTWTEIGTQLPSEFGELIKTDFVSSYLSEGEIELTNALDDNSLLNWTPKTPIHFFHGEADEIVPIANVYSVIESFETRGATNIQLTTIPGGTHASAGPAAIIGAIEWIESFKLD
jgi:predicted esterase